MWPITWITSIEILLNWNTVMHQLLKSGEVNPILIYTPTTISTWLCPKIFCHRIKNLDSPTSKHSELLAIIVMISDKRDTYAHILYEQSLSAERSVGELLVLWWCTPTSHLYAIPVSPHSLVKRITNLYGIQRRTLDKHHHPLMAYHLVANIFKNYSINPHLLIVI